MLICEKISRIIQNKKKLEKILGITIKNRGKEVTIEGTAENEYTAELVIRALEFGFPFSVALKIKEEDYGFEVLNIKDHTTRKDLKRIRARIIGKKGKSFSTLQSLTKCHFELKDNEVGIIGDPEYLKNAQDAIISLIKGSKHSNVYSHLEKHQVKPVLNLGLKE